MSLASCILYLIPLHANWEYGGGHDDGGRLLVSAKGGVAMPFASMKNDLGGVIVGYYTDGNGNIFNNNTCDGAGCNPTTPIATADLGKMPLGKKYDSFSWAGGASVGMVPDGRPNIRIELDWLYISETDYNANPLFLEELDAIGFEPQQNPVAVARSTVSTDVVSAMIYYDFLAGERAAGQMIPYVGIGLGYATSETVLSLSDNYADLQADISICSDFGEQNGNLCDFYTSTTRTGNFAVSGAVGMSYGMDEGVFLDIGARASYIPRIRWALNNDGKSDAVTPGKSRDIFSAHNIVFLNVYAGLRFEF